VQAPPRGRAHGRRDVISIRASSIGDLFDCAARWEAKNLRGLRMPTSGKAVLGTAIHKSTGLYDQSNLDGAGLKIEECEGAAADAIHKPDEDVQWDDDLNAIRGREDRALAPQALLRRGRAEAGLRGRRGEVHVARNRGPRDRALRHHRSRAPRGRRLRHRRL
jgi:hypothetical protein